MNKCLRCGERIPGCKCIKMNIEEAKKILDDMRTWDCILPNRMQTEAIETVLNELQLRNKLIVRKNARLNEYAEELVKAEKVIHELVMYLLEADNENIKDIVCDNCPHQECQNYEGEITSNCIREYFYRRVDDNEII